MKYDYDADCPGCPSCLQERSAEECAAEFALMAQGLGNQPAEAVEAAMTFVEESGIVPDHVPQVCELVADCPEE